MTKQIKFKLEKHGYCGTCWYTFTKEDYKRDKCESCPSCESKNISKTNTKDYYICQNCLFEYYTKLGDKTN